MRYLLFLVLVLVHLDVNSDYVVTTTSGITDGYKKNGAIYWDDIPYAIALLAI